MLFKVYKRKLLVNNKLKNKFIATYKNEEKANNRVFAEIKKELNEGEFITHIREAEKQIFYDYGKHYEFYIIEKEI